MKNIDFLPKTYLSRRASQKRFLTQLTRVGLVVGFLLAATVWQVIRLTQVAADVAQVKAEYKAATAKASEYQTLEAQSKTLNSQAALFAYLHYPWPRSQLLNLVTSPLHDSITLTRIQIHADKVRDDPSFGPSSLTEVELARHNLTEQALYRLRSKYDPDDTIVWIEGSTKDPTDLYNYVSRLARERLIVRAELDSLTTSKGAHAWETESEFRVRLVVARGYLQTGGPTKPPPTSQSHHLIRRSMKRPSGRPPTMRAKHDWPFHLS